MKPFNLEAALAGAPVITRDGHQVSDLHLFSTVAGEVDYPLIAAIGCNLYSFTLEGEYCAGERETSKDLFMAPVKKQGWIVLCPATQELEHRQIFSTEEAAVEFCGAPSRARVCVKIEWEE